MHYSVPCVILAGLLTSLVDADVYMHNPRGSNDRNREQSDRQNENRMFNSQNNAAGGYAWAGDPKVQRSADPLRYFPKSKLRLEWTVQHSCGPNGNAECDFIIQYMSEPIQPGADQQLRDGYPTGPLVDRAAGYQRATFTDPKQNQDGTRTFPLPTTFPGASGEQFAADDPDFGTKVNPDVLAANFATFCAGGTVGAHKGIEFGYHESCASYRRCTTTQRNKGLYTADQALGGDSAQFTRQGAGGARHGLECPEERDYYPYWRATEWKDIAILTSNLTFCATQQSASQNVKDRYHCEMPADSTALAPISAIGCQKVKGQWVVDPAWGIPAPECLAHGASRDNHLGNVVSDDVKGLPAHVETQHYDWIIPKELRGQRVVIRYRYNMSASTYESHGDFAGGDAVTSSLNCAAGQTGANGGAHCSNDLSRDGLTALYQAPYVKLWDPIQAKDGMNHVHLALQINTNQVGRTFQDRSYEFEVKDELPDCVGEVINVNVRGKRGNIVQTYPATEYDFVPSRLALTTTDCIDLQWTGSDFNPTNQAGEGADQTDRHNIVEVRARSTDTDLPDMMHLIPKSGPTMTMFDQPSAKSLAYAGQDLNKCANLIADSGNTDEQFSNCAKLNAAPNTYRHPTLLSFATGVYNAISTRNNNFSNRTQKLYLVVSSGVNVGLIVAASVVGVILVSIASALLWARARPDSRLGKSINTMFKGRRALASPNSPADPVKVQGAAYQNVVE